MRRQTLCCVFVGVAAVAVAARRLRRRFQFVVVTGESMNPAFHHGDLVIGRRQPLAVSKGDAIVFAVDPGHYVHDSNSVSFGDRPERLLLAVGRNQVWLPRRLKRIIAVGGDPAPASLPMALTEQHGGVVPRDHIAVAGDNPNSEGSAQFGYVELAHVESVVIGRLRRGRARGTASRRTSAVAARAASARPGRALE